MNGTVIFRHRTLARSASWFSLGLGLIGIVYSGQQEEAMAKAPTGTTPFRLTVPIGLTPPPPPNGNPLTVQGVNLGRRLFNEVRLSGNDTMACSSCHKADFAFSDQGKTFSTGIDGIEGTRNAPALFNVAYMKRLFWDGRSPSLRDQALQPIQNPIEMHQSLEDAVGKLTADASYRDQFAKAFGSPGITPQRIGLAIEQFEWTLLSGGSKFDLAKRGMARLTAQEQRGMQVFNTPFNPRARQFGGDCARCHGGPLFTDNKFHNNGLDITSDLGLGAITGNPDDNLKFKTPSLRNLAVTGPYMHNGHYKTLEEAVAHYNDDITPSPTLDPILARQRGGVHLSPADTAAVVAFLKTLRDPRMAPGGHF